jgi:hypothetical protein
MRNEKVVTYFEAVSQNFERETEEKKTNDLIKYSRHSDAESNPELPIYEAATPQRNLHLLNAKTLRTASIQVM